MYDLIHKIINKFKYYYTYTYLDKMFKRRTKVTSIYKEWKVISYDSEDLKYLVTDEEILNWSKRKYLCIVAGQSIPCL